LTLDQLLQIYHGPDLKFLNVEAARRRDAVQYQLWRNLIFAEAMSKMDSPKTEAFVLNLVRKGKEEQVCEPILTLLNPDYRDRFEQITWEDLYQIAAKRRVEKLCRYMRNKTASLKPAFDFSGICSP